MMFRTFVLILAFSSIATAQSVANTGANMATANMVSTDASVAAAQNNNTRAARAHGITVRLNKVPLSEAIERISSQMGLKVFYGKAETLLLKRLVSVNLSNMPLSEALYAVTKNTGVTTQLSPDGGSILVRVGTPVREKLVQGTIIGRVVDGKTGRGIFGATVSVGNNTHATNTGEDGSYRIVGIPAGSHTVTVRLVGYAKQSRSVAVGDDASVTVDFRLEPSASVLDQVVVTGTVATTELKAVPSAITVVTAKQIEERGITSIDQLFHGEIPGLFALNSGSSANFDEVTMYSRGATKTVNFFISGNTNPIKTYVDGIEMADFKYLSQIDPKSIERIEILTGPQASTIYGANAINGVMQIFTKRGTTTRPSITLNLSEGFAQNNLSSGLSSSHQYNGSISGTEGKLSYNIGLGWDYTGAWSPGKQMQRTSGFGGGRYQSGPLNIDFSIRQGRTQNNVRGPSTQVDVALAESGRFTRTFLSGLATPVNIFLNGQTLGLTLGYTPVSWWSHQVILGSDASDTERRGKAPIFQTPNDTAFTNEQIPNRKVSQSYASTLQIPIVSLAHATFVFGVDHWRAQSSSMSWSVNPPNQVASPSITRNRPTKNSGAYVQGQLGLWDALFLTYGVRTDWNPNYGREAKVRPGRYGVAYSKDLGIISAKLRGSYGRSIRPPGSGFIQGTLNSSNATIALYGSAVYDILPSPELGPEFQQGGEGGLELYLGDRGSLVITRYNQTIDGLINSATVDSVRALDAGPSVIGNCDVSQLRSDGYCYKLQSQFLNVGSIRNQGWELQGVINTGPFTTRGTYSWTKSRVIGITPKYRALFNFNENRPGQTFNFVPEHTWAMNVSYSREGTNILLNVNGVGMAVLNASNGALNLVTTSSLRLMTEEAYRIGTPSNYRQAQAGYETVNMNASQRFSKRIEATLQVTNLTNFYRNDANFRSPTLGRQTLVGLRLRLN